MSSIPTMQEIINLYLYGEKNIPENLLNPEIVNRPLDATTTINVDMNEFMRYSAGRYVHPANFLAVRKFLLGEYDSKLSAGTYNTEQFFDAIGVPKNPESRSLEVSNYTLDTSSSDYLDRSYVFGSMSFRINKDAKFIVEEDGSRYIKNIAVEANNDNFDYKSDNFFALVTNSMTEGIIDPFKIGRKVHINFVGNNSDVMDLGEGHIRLLFSHINFFDSISSPIPNIPKLIEGLYSITKGLNYIDKDGNLIVYGSQENDDLTYHKAILLNYIFGNINTFNSNISFVGGNNFDTILGGSKNDIILGNDGTDVLRGAMGDDTLIGGLDVDTLYGGDNDDTLIGGMSEDDPTDNNAQNELYGEAGNDTLKGSGQLEGGVGFDKYYAYDTAIIKDEDGKGEVYLAVGDAKILLTGGVRTSRMDDTLYESSDGSVRYVWNKTANTLTINDTLTLENWKNGELGIRLGMGHDIAFIIDVSGSMKDDMQTIVGSIDRVADALFYATPASQDNRIAVATYETNTTILQKFTNHETTEGRVSAFKEAMAKVPAMVQGGVEHVYQAIYDVLIGKAGAWRQDADTRTIFVFGDEPGDDRHLKPMVDSLANNLGYTVNNFTRSATRSVGGASLASYRIALSDTRTNNEMSENSTSQNSSLSVVVNTISIGNHSLDNLVNQINNTSYYSVGIQDIVDVLILALNDLTMSLDNVITINSENDVLNGKHGNDKLYGDNGNNTLNGDSGDDVLRGGSGNDTLNGGQGNDLLEGGDDNDTLYGNEGDDTLYGNDGDDTLDGGEGNDTLYGGDGDDVLRDNHGNNTLIGGRGYDVYHIHGSNDTIIDDKEGIIHIDSNLAYIPWGIWQDTGNYGMSAAESGKLAENANFLYRNNEIGHYEFSNNNHRMGQFIYDDESKTLTYKLSG